MKTFSLFISLYLMAFIGLAQMPAAISIEPPFATAYDTLTLIFDPAEACIQSGSLAGLDSIAIHSGVTYQDGPSWQCVIDFDGNGLNGQSTTLYPTGDGRFSITYVPYEFYGFPNGAVVTEICAVFNNGTNWDQDGRDFEDEFTCMDFFIPIAHSCLPQGIIFTTQEQIDNFQIDHPYCTEVEGDVEIYGDDITNLDGLNNILSIGGSLKIGNNIEVSGANPILSSLEGLGNVSAIGGDLEILGNDIIVDLTGLENLTSIGGSLIIGEWWNSWICSNLSLLSLDGLDNLNSVGGRIQIFGGIVEDISSLSNLTSINGDLHIRYLSSLMSLNGLNNIFSISGNLYLRDLGLTNLSGLDNLSYIAGSVELWDNHSLTSLSGLNMLDSIGGYYLSIISNSSLENLIGLENLTAIGHQLSIRFNDTLTSLSGLDNIETASIDILTISDNKLLSHCDVTSICDYLGSPNGIIEIHDNAEGCNSQLEVEEACSSCLPEGITFETQAQIDSFQIMYPNCSEIEGDVEIGWSGNNITNLNGLSNLNSIRGHLSVLYNYNLMSLSGLESLTTLGGLTINDNNSLTSLEGLSSLDTIQGNFFFASNDNLYYLTGLESLTYIGGKLTFGDTDGYGTSLVSLTGLEALLYIGGGLDIEHNPSLTTLEGLEGLNTINGELTIGNCWDQSNYNLTSLAGLENINAGTISNLSITCNPLLSACDIHSICDYLVSPNADVVIENNAEGCNSQEEVEDACNSSISENSAFFGIKTQPNPFATSTTIEYELKQPEKVTLTIYDYLGKQAFQTKENQQQGKQQLIWNAESYADGVYFYRLQVRDAVANGKLLKAR